MSNIQNFHPMQKPNNSIGVTIPPSVFFTQLLPSVSSTAEADYLILCFLELVSGYRVLFQIFQYAKGSMVNQDYYRFVQKEIQVLEFYIDELKIKRENLKG